MLKPGTIFNMQMNGRFPVCALVSDISTEEDLYYVLNLETGDIDFEGTLDEVNNEIVSRRHRIIVSPPDVYEQIENENNRLSKFLGDLKDKMGALRISLSEVQKAAYDLSFRIYKDSEVLG